MRKRYTFWLTGLPSSGKTTLAASVSKEYNLVHLDSDEIREFLTPTPNFTQEERELVYRSLIYTSYVLNNNDHDVIVSATANLERYRAIANSIIRNYRTIYIDCPVEICEHRDVKGLYKKSRKGTIQTVPMRIEGQNDDYINAHYKNVDVFQAPKQYDLLINTSTLTLKDSIDLLRQYIEASL